MGKLYVFLLLYLRSGSIDGIKFFKSLLTTTYILDTMTDFDTFNIFIVKINKIYKNQTKSNERGKNQTFLSIINNNEPIQGNKQNIQVFSN